MKPYMSKNKSDACKFLQFTVYTRSRGAPIIGQFADNRYRPFDNRHRPIIGIGQ